MYDFKTLSDYDFELLCQDLLGRMLGEPLEGFRRGRDRGIDLRFAGNERGTTIVQCKHYANTPFHGLWKAVKNEAQKLERLKPQRYILATSQFLTPDSKEKLFQTLQPYCRSTADILGGNELNALLRRYPEVEKGHYKLWLTSSAVMEKIVHSDVFCRSELQQETIRQKLKLYVQSKTAYEKALNLLHTHSCCIISGIPGIGKTTLADILMVYYLDQGYQIIKIRSDIQEALRAYHKGEKQLFIYDDFLGSTTLEMKQNKNEAGELLNFLSHISRQKGKKFILTTREYILRQAQQEYEPFARQDFDYNRCVLSLEDYTKMDRAHILYNHLYFYHVPQAWVEDLLTDGRVMRLIEHPNYNPRLIETVVKMFQMQGHQQFFAFFKDTLDHPAQLWENAFRRQLSPAGRDLVLIMETFGRSVGIDELKRCYTSYHRRKSREENRVIDSGDFMDGLKEAENTFLKIDNGQVLFHNPSISDFVKDYLRKNSQEFALLCEEAVDFGQVVRLGDLIKTWDEVERAAIRSDFVKAAQRLFMEDLDDRLFWMIDSPGKRIVRLLSLFHSLQFDELREMSQALMLILPEWLAQETERLGEENWQWLDNPSGLSELITAIFIFEDEQAEAFKALLDGAIQYIPKWFSFAFLYDENDFLALRDLQEYQQFSIHAPEFHRVCESFKDFTEEILPECIDELRFEVEADELYTKLSILEKFFEEDLKAEKQSIDAKVEELLEEDEDSYEEDRDEDGRFAETEDILGMFESLRDREPQMQEA